MIRVKGLAVVLGGVLILVAGSFGCAHTRHSLPEDTVSGYYDGDWYGPNPARPLGELTCWIVPEGDDGWKATFTAKYGGVGEYEVALNGRREGEKVVFGGAVDLGETAGGVFNWTGEIVGSEFNGAYDSKGIDGTFKMVRMPGYDDKGAIE